MKQRCNNPKAINYGRYGAKGIKVCKEWRKFEPFYEWAITHGYGDGLTIDRKDSSKGYAPLNCRWITKAENSRNKAKTTWLEYQGKRQTAGQWSQECGIKVTTILMRIRSGWTVADALTKPVRKYRRKETMEAKRKMLESLLPDVQKINDEVIKLRYSDSKDAVVVEFSTGYLRDFKITGLSKEEIFEVIREYLTVSE